jgi:hypothetical protein
VKVDSISIFLDSIPNRLDLKAAALLIETRAANKEELKKQIQFITNSLSNIQTIGGIKFTDIPAEYNKLWDIRKGLIPVCYTRMFFFHETSLFFLFI